ncbi:MAG: hypothetical protein ACJ8H8_23715 [Geminicoccaceae bacterium]
MLFGTPKNNLGRSDLPSLRFRIERQKVADHGGTAPSADIRRHGAAAGHSYDSLKRARKRLGLEITNTNTVPRMTFWSLRDTQLDAGSGR